MLNGGLEREKVRLPLYPFAEERCWLPTVGAAYRMAGAAEAEHALHPLVGRNISNFYEQKYAAALPGGAFYFTDHVVNGVNMLPGVAYLEMARAAGELSAERPVEAIKDLAWLSPVVSTDSEASVGLEIQLLPDGDNAAFEIGSSTGNIAVHAQGTLVFGGDGEIALNGERPQADLEALRARCTSGVSGSAYYGMLAGLGFAYGPRFRTIQSWMSSGTEAVAELELPESLTTEWGQYRLHPAMLDGALQAVVGLHAGSSLPGEGPLVPFFLEEMKIYAPLTERCIAYVTYEGDVMRMYNVRLVDERGNVLVDLRGLMLKRATKAERLDELEEADRELLESFQQLATGELNAEEVARMMR
ncbi:polyketide synthase dehydratase domain-containing protein [Paenibacillus sp. MMS18-CY102]|uniref:polyketide synthase dehydratase domain-containing protein n=1 Tax=Paenibacillus sp. MMS18-CY102 TaxID=2682849 RepID=UPI003FA76304